MKITLAGRSFSLDSPESKVEIGRSPRADLPVVQASRDLVVSRVAAVVGPSLLGALLANSGSMPLDLEIDGGTSITLAPGSAPLVIPTGARGVIWLKGQEDYAVPFALEGPTAAPLDLEPRPSHTGRGTSDLATMIGLTAPERRLLAAMAEPRLQDPRLGETVIPTSAELAQRLGRSEKQLEKTLDSLAQKLEPYIEGLIGSNDRGRATARRYRIVSYAIDRRLVDMTDVQHLI